MAASVSSKFRKVCLKAKFGTLLMEAGVASQLEPLCVLRRWNWYHVAVTVI